MSGPKTTGDYGFGPLVKQPLYDPMTSNRSVSEMVDRDENTALGRLAMFASETNDYTIRAEQMRPDVRELLAALSSQAQSDDVVERIHAALTWIGPLFIDEETPADELRRRISFCRADAESALATLNESSAIGGGDGR